ncbi:MAG: DUF4230 domain-containing protein [Intestinibacillus sp.]
MQNGTLHTLKRRIALAAVAAAVLVATFTVGAVWSRSRAQPPAITNDLLSQQLVSVSELATVEYHYTNMGKFENQADFYGWKVPLTRKSFIISYDGVIKAGVDASQVQADVSGGIIRVTLPETKILSHEIDDDSIEIFDETKNIFNPLQISDYTGFAADQKAKIEQRALENGLLDEARTRAAEAVRGLLTRMPGIAGVYAVEVG